MDIYQKREVDNYNAAVKDWIANAHHSFANGVPPRPFPAFPTEKDSEGNDLGNPLIPISEVPIRFTTVNYHGRERLAIVVPDLN